MAAKMLTPRRRWSRRPASAETLAGLLADARGVVDSGIPDLGSNPKHLKDFGRRSFRARAGRGAGKAKGRRKAQET